EQRFGFRVAYFGRERITCAGIGGERFEIECLIARVGKLRFREEIDEGLDCAARALRTLWADNAARRGEHRVRRVTGGARRFGRGERRVAVKINAGTYGGVDQCAVVLTTGFVQQ